MINVMYVAGSNGGIRSNQKQVELILQNTGEGHEFVMEIRNYEEYEREESKYVYFEDDNVVKQLIHALQTCLSAQEFDIER